MCSFDLVCGLGCLISGKYGISNRILIASQSAQDAQSDNHTFSGAPKHSVMGNEAELVNDICEPGGMRLQPALENLERFLFMASSLSGPKIAQELRAKIVRCLFTTMKEF